MSLSISKTIRMTHAERVAFERWTESFIERAFARPQFHDSDPVAEGERNLARALRRKYGCPAFMFTGSNNDYTLNLGNRID